MRKKGAWEEGMSQADISIRATLFQTPFSAGTKRFQTSIQSCWCTGRAILSCETNFPEHPQPHGRTLSPGDVNTTTGEKNKNDERREIALTSRLITLTGRVINRRRKNFGKIVPRPYERERVVYTSIRVCERCTTQVSLVDRYYHQFDFGRGD